VTSRRPGARGAQGPGTLKGGAGIAIAVIGMNVATYGYTMLAARRLGPSAYGGFAAVMSLLLVLSVASLALQATAARRVSRTPEDQPRIAAEVLRTSTLAACGLGLVLLVLAPAIDPLLRLDDLRLAVLVAVTAVPMTIMGGQAGVLQGERRWGPLALLYTAAGAPRLLLGGSLLFWVPTELAAVLGVTVSAFAPTLVGWWALRADAPRPALGRPNREIVRETVRSAQSLLAFFALSNLDIVVARQVLDQHDSGLYAAGLILAKAMLFLPQFVVVLAFPSMASGQRRLALLRSTGVIAGLGALGVAGCLALPDFTLGFVGGPEFAGVRDHLWVFALLGTVLSALQLLIYAAISRPHHRGSVALWLGLLAMVLAGSTASTASELVARVTVVDAALLVVLLARSALLDVTRR
jgi:O-antigen/teichoic acid export membrane protein